MKFTTYVNVQDQEPEILSAESRTASNSGSQPLFGHIGGSRSRRQNLARRWPLYAGLVTVTLASAVALLGFRSHQAATRPIEKTRWSEGQYSIVPSAGWRDADRSSAALPLNTDTEVRFGIAAPFTGPSKELGREMALGLNAAFDKANDSGGIAGRKIKLITADDGYEPTRTAAAVAKLHEVDGVLGYVGNVGTPTAAISLPYALKNHMLFFGAFTGAESLRSTPPDRYVFNYRPSYAEETEAAVHYLVRVRGIHPNEIAVFAQQDGYGDSGFNGVTKAMRTLGSTTASSTLRMNYARNSLDLKSALTALDAHKGPIKAVVMIASYRPAAKFIENVRPKHPGMLFTNVSFVGSSALADELKLLGPRYMDNIMVTQTVPSISGYSTIAMEYKSALERYFPGEAPDYVSFEGFVEGKLLLEALRHTGRDLSTERLVSTLETLNGVDLGLGTPLAFSPSEHQASHKIWGTQLTPEGTYKAIDLD